VQEAINSMKLSSASASITQVEPIAKPVIEINPRPTKLSNVCKSGNATNTSSITVFQLPANKQFWLTSCYIALAKDATCDAATGIWGLAVIVDGATVYPLRLPIATLTASSQGMTLTLAAPLKVDVGTLISGSSLTFTAGTCSRTVGITGYIEDGNL